MLNSYLMVFNTGKVERSAVIKIIDAEPKIVNWLAFFPSAIILISEENVNDLSEAVRIRSENSFQFIVTDLDSNNGWLPKSTWTFINEPKEA